MQKLLCPSPDGMTLAIAQAVPLCTSPTLRHILFWVMPVHSCSWRDSSLHITLLTWTPSSLTETLPCSAAHTSNNRDNMNPSILLALTFFLTHAMQCHTSPSHIQETAQQAFHPTPAMLLGLSPSGNLDFGRLLILCPGVTCKVVPSSTSTAKAQ